MHGHQVHGVGGVERGVGLVAHGQPIEVRGDSAQRGVAAVLDAAQERAELLEVLARLLEPRPAQLDAVGRLVEDEVDQLGRRHAVGAGAPPGGRCPSRGKPGLVGRIERRIACRRV